MLRESQSWQPFGPQGCVAAMPHKGSAIRVATAGGTGCWPLAQYLALAGAESASISPMTRYLTSAS